MNGSEAAFEVGNGSDTRQQPWGAAATLAWAFAICALMVAAQLMAAALMSALVLPEGASKQQIGAQLSSGRSSSLALLVSAVVVSLAIAGVIAVRRGPPLRAYLALRRVAWTTLAKSAGLALLLTLLMDLWLTAWDQPRVHASVRHQLATVGNLLPLFIVGVVMAAPLWEELLFRGFMQTGLSARLPHWVSAVITSVTWTLLHAQYGWLEWIPLIATGLALAELRRREGSLLPTLLCHSLVNTLAIAEALWT